MSEESKPVILEDKTQHLRDIIEATEAEFTAREKLSPGEAKRIELIRKMKSDTDKKEYMIMFNILMALVVISSVVHFIFYGHYAVLAVTIAGLLYFVLVRLKLRNATFKLSDYKNNFDKYLWEGFYLKEMRHSAVKLAFLIFFPLLMVFISDLISGSDDRISYWLSILVGFVLSSLAWLFFFGDDKNSLEIIESDLRALQYL